MADFDGCGKTPGVEKWRIEEKHAKKMDFDAEFYTGDSYILLSTEEKHGSLEWHIHFWQGKESDTAEKGISALKTVELDDAMGGAPIQHREVQDYESAAFMSLFAKHGGIVYCEGGVDSGFNHVDPEAYESRLYHLKGKRSIRSTQVEMSSAAMNHGDVFVLDAGLMIYVWSGSEANKYETRAGTRLAEQLKGKRPGADVHGVAVGEDGTTDNCKKFWSIVGPHAAVGDADPESDESIKPELPKLFKVSDADGEVKMTQEGEGQLAYSMLDTNDIFIVDVATELYVWAGAGASKEEKDKSMSMALQYLKEQGKPPYLPTTGVREGKEPVQFRCNFAGWPAPPAEEKKVIKKKATDLGALYGKKTEYENEGDDRAHIAGGKTKVWRVEDLKLVEYPEEHYGEFYEGDAFIVLYEYTPPGKNKAAWMLYFWLGRSASQDEVVAAAKFAVDMDDSLGGAPVQVRVVQNKEPDHFLALWGGKMCVHAGGKASGFKNRNSADQFDTDGVSLYHVRGSSPLETRAIQVKEEAGALNSGDVFVLLTPEKMFVWNGGKSNDDEKACGQVIAKFIGSTREVVVVEEGEEGDDFWSPIGGKGEYVTEVEEDAEHEPRLFHMSSNLGYFRVDEVDRFTQDDLLSDDVFLLDTYTEVYVWVGNESSKEEQLGAIKAALEYVSKMAGQDGRSADVPAMKVMQGNEPPMFTCHFLGWDFGDTLEAAAEPEAEGEVAAEKPKPKPAAKPAAVALTMDDASEFLPFDHVVSHDDLMSGAGGPKIDPAHKEMYLGDAEFETLFKCSKAEFKDMKGWKKKSMKEKNKLW